MTEPFGSTRLPRSAAWRPVVTRLGTLALAATTVVVGAAQSTTSPAPEAGIHTRLQSAGPAQGGASQGGQGTTAGWSDGFMVQSANGDYRLQFGLLLHADGRFALDDETNAVVDTFGIRRLRP